MPLELPIRPFWASATSCLKNTVLVRCEPVAAASKMVSVSSWAVELLPQVKVDWVPSGRSTCASLLLA